MSGAPKRKPKFRRPQIRANLERLRASRNQGMFGVAEIISLGVSLLLLLVVGIAYIYLLVPARSRRESLQLERSNLQTQLRGSEAVISKDQTTEATVLKITDSLEGFQNERLSNSGEGRMGLYGELNQLIRKNGLRNTAGPAYTPLVSSAVKQSAGTKSANTRWQSVYPGISVSLTVEGQYQNLRRFIRDLEVSKQFIIINTVELERAQETNAPVTPDGTGAPGARSSLVSLRLEMATYFRLGAAESSGTGQ